VTDFPSRWPSFDLPLDVRRNLQLIAAEAVGRAIRERLV
jgi:hypothetical protein